MDVRKVQEWFNDTLNSRNSSEETISAHSFMVQSVYSEVDAIEKLVSSFGEVLATTVRQSVNEDRNYLRPLSTWPDAVLRYFHDEKTQKPFDIPTLAEFLRGSDIEIADTLPGPRAQLIGDYCCRKAKEGRRKDSIQGRIREFLAKVEDESLKAALVNAHCLAVLDVEGKGRGPYKVRSMLAIYYERSSPPSADAYVAIKEAASALFDNVRMLRNLDATVFRSKSAELINNLVGLFTNDAVAKADKIAFALQQIRKLAAAHLIGRKFSAHSKITGPQDDPKEAISAHFIQTRFERIDQPHDVMPKLELYPLAMALENPLGALLVANPDLPMLTKLLLRKYMHSEETHLFVSRDEADRAIKQSVRKGLKKLQGQAQIDGRFCARVDMRHFGGGLPGRTDDELAISRLDSPDLWAECYRNIEANRNPRECLVAFVVEGEIIDACHKARLLPHGILFFEGWFIDSFSRADIETLRILAVGFSSLVRLTSHAMSPLSYDKAIWETYRADVSPLGRLDHSDHAEVLFHFLRLDAALLHKVRRVGDDIAVMNTLIDAEKGAVKIASEFIKRFGDALSNERDEEVNFRKAGRLLRERRAFYLRNASKVEDFKKEMDAEHGVGAFIAFLRSCPSNFIWAPYLGTVGEVLADRISNRVLTMARINVGFSADAVILAAVNGEFSQIVKLASKRKLKAERDAYQRFVRYRVPYAARQPLRGLALDSSGSFGWIEGRNKDTWVAYASSAPESDSENFQASFGALVSDVVDGERPRRDDLPHRGAAESERIETLESKIAEELWKAEDHDPEKATDTEINHVLLAIKDHFRIGIKLWRVPQTERRDWEAEPIGKHPLGQTSVARLIEHRLRLNEIPLNSAVGLGDHIEATMRSLYSLGFGDLFAKVSGSDLRPEALIGWLRLRAEKISIKSDNEAAPYLTQKLEDAAASNIARPEVIHGDLNPRNLAWAHTFSRFFMIDFERTGYGMAGIDHWKLASSLLVDIFWAAHARQTEGYGARARVAERIGNYIDQVLQVFDGFTDLMEGPDDPAGKARVKRELDEFAAANHSRGVNFLTDAIAAILLTLFTDADEPDSRKPKKPLIELSKSMASYDRNQDGRNGRQKRFTVNLYIACCAALRELQYSIEDLESLPKDSFASLVHAFEAVDRKMIGPLAKAGINYVALNKDQDSQQQLRTLIRAIIAFRLLLAALPAVEARGTPA